MDLRNDKGEEVRFEWRKSMGERRGMKMRLGFERMKKGSQKEAEKYVEEKKERWRETVKR